MSERAPSVVLASAGPDGVHVVLSGDLDAAGAQRLRGQLDEALEAAGRLTLDLSRVTRLSVDALQVLLSAHRRLRDSGGSLVLSAVSPAVVRVLRTSGLHGVLVPPPPAVPQPAARRRRPARRAAAAGR